MKLHHVKSFSEYKSLVDSARICVVHFSALWAPQCNQVNDVLVELAAAVDNSSMLFCSLEAESVPELVSRFHITAVPTCLIIVNDSLVSRVDGVKIAELRNKVEEVCKKSQDQLERLKPLPTAQLEIADPNKAIGDDELDKRLRRLIARAKCMLFMKGTRDTPRCGFSRQIVEILVRHRVQFETFDILADEAVRQGLKRLSDWPTYPQLYVNGELIGGLDIVKELESTNELTSLLATAEMSYSRVSTDDVSANDARDSDTTPLSTVEGVATDEMVEGGDMEKRLVAVTTAAKRVLFMKGSREQPRCGFSRKVVELLEEVGCRDFETFDVLRDEWVRQQLKMFAQFPTYPQLWVDGRLVGGLDILQEYHDSGELLGVLGM